MFYPQEMTEVELIVPEKDMLSVTRMLSGMGIFHQADATYLSSDRDASSANTWQDTAGAYASLERRIQVIMQNLNIVENLSLDASFETMIDLNQVRPMVEQIEQAVRSKTDQSNAEQRHLEQIENSLKQLEPVADVDVELEAIRNPHFIYTILGMMPTENMERLQVSLSRIPFVFLPLRQDSKHAVVWLSTARSNAEVLDRAARSAYLNPLLLPEAHQGTPAQVIRQLQDDTQATHKKIETLHQEIAELRTQHEKDLQSLLWEVRANRMLTEAIVRYGKLRYTYLIVGWVASSGLGELTRRLKEISKEALIESYPAKRDGSQQETPVSLNNPRILSPFQMLVTTYARPRYEELDPTFLIGITFPLLFGAMFGDVGHGLSLVLLGWLISSRRVKFLNSLASLGGLIVACGIFATGFGFLYGSVFGVETLLHPLWFHPLENIMEILYVSIGAGIVLLNVGFIAGLVNAWKARNWSHFFFNPNGLSGLVLYWSLLGLAGGALLGGLPIPPVVFVIFAVISGLVVALSELFSHLIQGHRPLIEGGPVMYGIQAFFELFEALIGYLSNSLSYVRVGAFAVAHGGLSAVVFLMGELVSPGHGIGYWVVVAGGNLFIIGFEGLIVGIQTMRLEYYEFFSKFFQGGGVRYEPLTIRPNVDR